MRHTQDALMCHLDSCGECPSPSNAARARKSQPEYSTAPCTTPLTDNRAAHDKPRHSHLPNLEVACGRQQIGGRSVARAAGADTHAPELSLPFHGALPWAFPSGLAHRSCHPTHPRKAQAHSSTDQSTIHAHLPSMSDHSQMTARSDRLGTTSTVLTVLTRRRPQL